MNAALTRHIEERLRDLREELDEAKRFGVNTPGFNQLLGAIDELKLLLDFLAEGET